MTRLRVFLLGIICCLLCPALATGQEAPRYKVDAAWPVPLPYTWAFGMINGLAVGPDDHIWVLHEPRNMPTDEIGAVQDPAAFDCCIPAPEVVEFDQNGKVVKAWSGRERISTWPLAAHGIGVDKKGNVWIAGVGKPGTPTCPVSRCQRMPREIQSRWTR